MFFRWVKCIYLLSILFEGHHQFDVAEDGYINASQAAVSILVRKISKTIATNLKETYVDFPEDESHRAESQQKYNYYYNINVYLQYEYNIYYYFVFTDSLKRMASRELSDWRT